MDKLTLLIREKEAELQELQDDLHKALTGFEGPDYEVAARIQPLIYGVKFELERLMQLASVHPPAEDFRVHVNRLLTEEHTVLELWLELGWHNPATVRIMEIYKLKGGRFLSCKLRIEEPLQGNIHEESTVEFLRHLGWKVMRGNRTFLYKSLIKGSDALDNFSQFMSATLLEGFGNLLREDRPQYYRFRK